VLVGHSLGGVVLRRALCDAADEWLERISEDPSTPKPCLLEANMRLFSPASAGFRPAGLLGFLSAGPAWLALNMYLRSSSAFADLQQDSAVLAVRGSRCPTSCEARGARPENQDPDDIG
jgi:pimeloyl-ACP methyl ester carboxylesterase